MYTVLPEQEFNFKVKVNYQNGGLSIHGPGPIQFIPSSASVSHIPDPMNITSSPHQTFNQKNMPILPTSSHFNPLIANSPPFSISTASPSQTFDPQTANFNKISSSKFPVYSSIDSQNNSQQVPIEVRK
jgi:hypothetical protein